MVNSLKNQLVRSVDHGSRQMFMNKSFGFAKERLKFPGFPTCTYMRENGITLTSVLARAYLRVRLLSV